MVIDNKTINKYIHENLLKVCDCELTQNDLEQIETIAYSGLKLIDKKDVYNYNFMKYLTNLKSFFVEYVPLNDEIIENLNSVNGLENLSLYFCLISASSKIDCNIRNIYIDKCNCSDFSFMSKLDSLEELKLINVNTIDIKDITKFENLKTLYICNSKIINAEKLNSFKRLSVLVLDGSEIDNEESIMQLGKNIQVQRNEFYCGTTV